MIIDPATAPVSGENGVGTLHLSVAGGVTQFGAYVDTLQPGAYSSHRHWHSNEDEFIYVIEGTATVIDDDGNHALNPGDAACWRHGDPNAHHVTNLGDRPCRYVIVGSRAAKDVCTYPDSGRRLVNSDETWVIYDANGAVERSGNLPSELLDLPPVWGIAYDPALSSRRIVREGEAKIDRGTPEQAACMGAFEGHLYSDTGGLSQFGAFTETLMPGARSSDRHWHEKEDEFLFMLKGEATLVENDGAHPLRPGDAAAWPKGVQNAHHVINRSGQPCTYLIVGTRLSSDRVHYADVDKLYTRKDGVVSRTRRDGSPLSRQE